MASLQLVRDHFHVSFRCAGHRFKRSLKTRNETSALARKARIEETIHLIESGRLEVPSDANVADFVLCDGKVGGGGNGAIPSPHQSLKDVFSSFFDSIPEGCGAERLRPLVQLQPRLRLVRSHSADMDIALPHNSVR